MELKRDTKSKEAGKGKVRNSELEKKGKGL